MPKEMAEALSDHQALKTVDAPHTRCALRAEELSCLLLRRPMEKKAGIEIAEQRLR